MIDESRKNRTPLQEVVVFTPTIISFVASYHSMFKSKKTRSHRRFGPFPIEMALLVPSQDANVLADILWSYAAAFSHVDEAMHEDLCDMAYESHRLSFKSHAAKVLGKKLTIVHGRKAAEDLISAYNDDIIQSDHLMEAELNSTYPRKKALAKYMMEIYRIWWRSVWRSETKYLVH